MLSIFNIKHITWTDDGDTSLDYYELFADSDADIPSDVYCFSSEKGRFRIAQGSMIYVIGTSVIYMLNSESEWVEQESSGGSGFTPTSEQLEAMNSGITAEYVEMIINNASDISAIQQTIGDINTALTNINTALGGVI